MRPKEQHVKIAAMSWMNPLLTRTARVVAAACIASLVLSGAAFGQIVGGVASNDPVPPIVTGTPPAQVVPTSTTINFDDRSAPSLFANAVRLTETYASMGVHFAGRGGLDGGAILDQDGAFGVNAHSGRNFLAFNRYSTLSDSGIPTVPETITFDSLMSAVSIYAAGGSGAGSLTMVAYDAAGTRVDSASVTTSPWALLRVASAGGIKRVVLDETSLDQYFVFDDLSFQALPEPATLSLLALGGAAVIARRRAAAKRAAAQQ
jgi:hypothetical protein